MRSPALLSGFPRVKTLLGLSEHQLLQNLKSCDAQVWHKSAKKNQREAAAINAWARFVLELQAWHSLSSSVISTCNATLRADPTAQRTPQWRWVKSEVVSQQLNDMTTRNQTLRDSASLLSVTSLPDASRCSGWGPFNLGVLNP